MPPRLDSPSTPQLSPTPAGYKKEEQHYSCKHSRYHDRKIIHFHKGSYPQTEHKRRHQPANYIAKYPGYLMLPVTGIAPSRRSGGATIRYISIGSGIGVDGGMHHRVGTVIGIAHPELRTTIFALDR